ncbi:MAG TPA: adenosylmethionine decarboxylase [Candidatus Atribacteria bacterium]|nr:adenosylmethionine decarboxylase [Candidatus Atribacteria bacterium]HPU08722.1 adenosylmethionine decarboxylase [Candidatus Atribacteria bacterium]HQE24976.1 adenosylmethionine decarboxylase [Candidatus Atribacteria bacterium]
MNLEEGIVARHLLVEIVGSRSLNEKEMMEKFLQDLAQIYKSEILALQVYQFQPFGLSALLVMPESHAAVHTWPEHGYAALDIFLKADLDPRESIPLIERYFAPRDIKIRELERGVKKKNGTLVHPGLHQ